MTTDPGITFTDCTAFPVQPGDTEALAARWEQQQNAADPLAPVYRWLVDELSFPFDMCTTRKPAWLDVSTLAAAWALHDGESPEDFVALIYAETGWPEEGSPS